MRRIVWRPDAAEWCDAYRGYLRWPELPARLTGPDAAIDFTSTVCCLFCVTGGFRYPGWRRPLCGCTLHFGGRRATRDDSAEPAKSYARLYRRSPPTKDKSRST